MQHTLDELYPTGADASYHTTLLPVGTNFFRNSGTAKQDELRE